jgi:hypothetical protein
MGRHHDFSAERQYIATQLGAPALSAIEEENRILHAALRELVRENVVLRARLEQLPEVKVDEIEVDTTAFVRSKNGWITCTKCGSNMRVERPCKVCDPENFERWRHARARLYADRYLDGKRTDVSDRPAGV